MIKLGPGNEEAAIQAVTAWPDGLHVGGGINLENARMWIERGAQKVIHHFKKLLVNISCQKEILRNWFANVKISRRPHENVYFRFGFSMKSYAKVQNFRSVGGMKLFLWPIGNCHFQ